VINYRRLSAGPIAGDAREVWLLLKQVYARGVRAPSIAYDIDEVSEVAIICWERGDQDAVFMVISCFLNSIRQSQTAASKTSSGIVWVCS
jgi:hypothetical protein